MKRIRFYLGFLLILALFGAMTGFAKAKVQGSITWWTPWSEDQGPQEMIAAFNKVYPNIKVEHVKFTNTDEGNVKIDMSLLAGQNIDVFFNFGINRVIPRIQKGLLQDLSGFIASDKLDMEAAFGKVVSSNAITRFINDTAKYPRDFTVTVAPLLALEKNQKENYNKGLYYFDAGRKDWGGGDD